MQALGSASLLYCYWLTLLLPSFLPVDNEEASLISLALASGLVAFDAQGCHLRLSGTAWSHACALGGGLCLFPLLLLIGFGLAGSLHIKPPGILAAHGPPDTVTLVSMALASPFIEEYVFRGRVLSDIRRSLGTIPSVLLSSVAFALIHMEPWLIGGALASGLVLGSIRVATGGISHGVCFHSGLNVSAIIGLSLVS